MLCKVSMVHMQDSSLAYAKSMLQDASRLQPGYRHHLLMRKGSSDIGNQKMGNQFAALHPLRCLHRM